jgi:hypothetical protein
LLQVSVHHVDALAIGLVRPVHVPDDIPWKAYLLQSRYPLIDIGD